MPKLRGAPVSAFCPASTDAPARTCASAEIWASAVPVISIEIIRAVAPAAFPALVFMTLSFIENMQERRAAPDLIPEPPEIFYSPPPWGRFARGASQHDPKHPCRHMLQ